MIAATGAGLGGATTGATGSGGDGLLKAAMADGEVEKIEM